MPALLFSLIKKAGLVNTHAQKMTDHLQRLDLIETPHSSKLEK